jgi:signal transduction histidine kinase
MVKDTGEGILPEDLPHIWERFYQTGRQRARSDSGAGLGLALVKEWMEEMGGTVSVESAVSEGSCFTLHFNRSIARGEDTTTKRISPTQRSATV